jgi:hypothetical protein
MSNNEPDDESTTDSQQESEQQPADSDQPSAQATDAPADSDQPAEQPDEQSQEQPAGESDQSTEQSEEEPTASDQPAQQSEAETDQAEQPSDDQSASESDQPEGQPAGSDQAPAQSEEQPADSDQPPTSETADNTQGSTGGASRAGGGGTGRSGPGVATKVQVIAKFMTNNANDPFKEGSITMNVFDGEKGTLLWKLGSMDQQKVTFQDATLTNNIIKSAMFSGVTGNSVKVELKVKMLETDHQVDPQVPEVNFGTAAKFEVPAKGPLNVDVDVEVTEKEFTVDAADEAVAGDAARGMLANMEEIHLSHVKSVTNVGAGRFRVVFGIITKRILILRPPTLELIY